MRMEVRKVRRACSLALASSRRRGVWRVDRLFDTCGVCGAVMIDAISVPLNAPCDTGITVQKFRLAPEASLS